MFPFMSESGELKDGCIDDPMKSKLSNIRAKISKNKADKLKVLLLDLILITLLT